MTRQLSYPRLFVSFDCVSPPCSTAVASDVNAIGFLGFANVAAAPQGVTVVTVSGASTSNPESYPFTRPLFNYYNGLFEEQRIEVQNQLCDAISPFGQTVVEEVNGSCNLLVAGSLKVEYDEMNKDSLWLSPLWLLPRRSLMFL